MVCTDSKTICFARFLCASIYFLTSSQPGIMADFSTIEQSPYAFGPQGRTVQDLAEFKKPQEMIAIIPSRPIVSRSKNGTKQYFSPNGKIVLSVSVDGSMTFTLKGMTIEKDDEGEITKQISVLPNSNIREIRNGKGEFLGYQELSFGNSVTREYDSNRNLSKTYEYDKFGKNFSYILDELTFTRTVFNSKGLPGYDVNYEGGVVARYFYDQNNVLIYKTDVRLNKTFYGINGEMLRTEDAYGNILVTYYYATNQKGLTVLDHSIDITDRTTYYKKGKPQIEKNKQGEISKEYVYDGGEKLVFTFEYPTRETVWYDKDGNPLYGTVDNYLLREWFYNKGRLIGLWDATKNVLTAYVRGDEVGKYFLFRKPAAEEIQEMIDNGVLQKQYIE